MLIYHWAPPLCENLPSKRVYLSMRNISIAKCCFFSSISPHNCLTIHPTRYLRAICTIFWHPASYILHEIPGRVIHAKYNSLDAKILHKSPAKSCKLGLMMNEDTTGEVFLSGFSRQHSGTFASRGIEFQLKQHNINYQTLQRSLFSGE